MSQKDSNPTPEAFLSPRVNRINASQVRSGKVGRGSQSEFEVPNGLEPPRSSRVELRPPPRSQAHLQLPSLPPQPCHNRGPIAQRWPSGTCGDGRSPTSGSGAPPEVQWRLRTFEKRKAGIYGSDILTLPGCKGCSCTLSGGTFPSHNPSSRASHHCPFPFRHLLAPGPGNGLFTSQRGTHRKRGRR